MFYISHLKKIIIKSTSFFVFFFVSIGVPFHLTPMLVPNLTQCARYSAAPWLLVIHALRHGSR